MVNATLVGVGQETAATTLMGVGQETATTTLVGVGQETATTTLLSSGIEQWLNIDTPTIIQSAMDFIGTAVFLILLFVVGYALGYFVVSNILRRILLVEKLQLQLVRYGATTTSMWKSIVEFSAQYVTWVIVFLFLTLASNRVGFLDALFFRFIVPLTLLIVLVIVGLLVGGFIGKLVKDTLVTIGLEEGLARYKVADSLGGVPISSILATIVKWYTFLFFVTLAAAQLEDVLSRTAVEILIDGMDALLTYIRQAILGFLIVLVSLVSANFVGNRIKYEKVPSSDFIAMGFEIVVIFFGIVLALPKFGIEDVSVMADSFKILMVGVALGLAIAIGFGLKSSVEKMGEKLK